MSEKELGVLLLKHGVKNQLSDSECYTDANDDEEIRKAGNASVANSLEFLGKHQIVTDVQPTFGTSGIGFSYRLNPGLVSELKDEQSIVNKINSLYESQDETSLSIAELIDKCLSKELNPVYKDDFVASLQELKICFNNKCYIACLALSGKILEISLKQLLTDNNIEFDDKIMIGRLIDKVKTSIPGKYIDQSLVEIAGIINRSRIPAVHAKEKVPVPSREQAAMVINAVIDTVNRTIVNP